MISRLRRAIVRRWRTIRHLGGDSWVNGNWRVTFRFIGQDVELVDYQDYR